MFKTDLTPFGRDCITPNLYCTISSCENVHGAVYDAALRRHFFSCPPDSVSTVIPPLADARFGLRKRNLSPMYTGCVQRYIIRPNTTYLHVVGVTQRQRYPTPFLVGSVSRRKFYVRRHRLRTSRQTCLNSYNCNYLGQMRFGEQTNVRKSLCVSCKLLFIRIIHY